ncbi:MAG: hypothetical protein RLZZ422_1209 [Pseudomonadota bacterium]
MVSVRRLAPLMLVAALSTGCAVQYDGVSMTPGSSRPQVNSLSPDLQKNISELQVALQSMDSSISPREAADVAYDAYIYPRYLANEWGLTWPPLYHNVLRNSKKRPAGLCTDWTQAMRTHMYKKKLKTFDLWWGVAYKGNAWREHSTLVMTAKGKPFDSGILLDPWRNSGELFWSRVPQDDDYPWKVFQTPDMAR